LPHQEQLPEAQRSFEYEARAEADSLPTFLGLSLFNLRSPSRDCNQPILLHLLGLFT
jgi:hypothetical protein